MNPRSNTTEPTISIAGVGWLVEAPLAAPIPYTIVVRTSAAMNPRTTASGAAHSRQGGTSSLIGPSLGLP
jgi:hypothetical protein